MTDKLKVALPINHMSTGMWPLNYCSRLVKEASDVMFSVAVNDKISAEVGLRLLEGIIDDLRKSMGAGIS